MKAVLARVVFLIFTISLASVRADEVGAYQGIALHVEMLAATASSPAPERLKWEQVQAALISMEISRLKLAVTDEEVDAAHAKRLELAGFDENAANRVVRTGAALKEALRQWQADPAKERAIYDEILAPLEVNQATWEAFKKSYPTPASLEKLWVPEDSAVARDAGKDSIRDELLRHRLAERVSGANIAAEGTGWEEFVKAQEAEIAAEDLPALKLTYVQQQVGAALDSWMARQVEDGKLTFSAPKYDEAIRKHARSLGKSEAAEE